VIILGRRQCDGKCLNLKNYPFSLNKPAKRENVNGKMVNVTLSAW